MSEDARVIEDGFTYSGYIREEPRLNPAVHIEYRRATHRERYQISHGYSEKQATPIVQSDHVIAVVCKYVKKWDLKWEFGIHKGEIVPLKPAEVGLQEYSVIERCYAMVLRFDGGDPDPDSKTNRSEASEQLDLLLRQESAEDAQIKNSEAA